MGVKTTITAAQLPTRYQHHTLIPTTDGITASVYLLDDLFVLKLFEKSTTLANIENEIHLLKNISHLSVPKVIDRFEIEGYHVLIYSQISGNIIIQPTLHTVTEIGYFLKNFHTQSKYITLSSEQIFTKKNLEALIVATGSKRLMYHFTKLNLTLYNDGIIHGDLFPDNCKFENETLSGVYDFSEACLGDFHFELAVVVVGFCFEGMILNEQKVNALLKSYGSHIHKEDFYAYIRYALLYYATTRFIADRDYKTLLTQLENITC